MPRLECRAPLFFITGLAWLILSSLLGLGLLFGMVLGTPLPVQFRLIHVHGALIGGVAQLILGAMAAFIPTMLMSGRERSESHPVLYLCMNLGTLAVLAGFGFQKYWMVSGGGFLVAAAFVGLLGQGLTQMRSSLVSPPLNLWFYGVAVLVLLAGIAVGEGIVLRLINPEHLGQYRLAHIHLNLLGFVTLTIIGTMHNLFPTVLNSPLHSPLLARITFFVMPTGVIALIIGFMTTNLQLQIGAGLLLIVGSLLYCYNIVRTWIDGGKPRNIASDHLVVATIFLVVAIATGILVSVNYLWKPPKLPFGTLHLMAYTHLALLGFVLQTIFGALSHLLPVTLAIQRVPVPKKRGPYLSQLQDIVSRWGGVQVTTLTMGTLALPLAASLVWQFPLDSPSVKLAAWLSILLLLASFMLFTVKIGLILGRRPPE